MPSDEDAARTEANGHTLPQPHVTPVVPTGNLIPTEEDK